MKSMIVISMLVACSMAQIALSPYSYAPGYATTYAAGYGYNTFSAGRTALEVFPAFNGYNLNLGYNSIPYAYAPGFPAATVAAAPAAVAAAVEPAAVEPAVVVKSADAEIVEAAPAGEVAAIPQIRPIFPVFTSDLRGGVSAISFARPSEVALPEGEAISDDFVVITPSVRSLPSVAASPAVAAPAGIVSATQPRFYSFSPFGQAFLKA